MEGLGGQGARERQPVRLIPTVGEREEGRKIISTSGVQDMFYFTVFLTGDKISLSLVLAKF